MNNTEQAILAGKHSEWKIQDDKPLGISFCVVL